MTDNSATLTLRWEIDDAVEKFATGEVKSEIFDEGGFKWAITADEQIDRDRNTKFTLRCDVGHNRPWTCEAVVNMRQCRADGSIEGIVDHVWVEEYIINDKAAFEVVINIISSDSGEPVADLTRFAASTRMSNVILKIGEEKLHVSKELLALHSPVFETMFFGDFAEKGQDEVEIKEVVFEEFIDLLHMIYPGRFTVTDSTVSHLLALADRYQIKDILDSSEEHLQTSIKFSVAEKLGMADRYRLSGLKDYCLQKYSTFQEVAELESTPEFANFSDAMKAAICVRLFKLIKQNT